MSPWPGGADVGLTLTFDDARPSQIEAAMPILDRHGVRATFFVSFPAVEQRLEEWREAARRGHEIGNHSWTHPCSGNFGFARGNPLEAYDLARMADDIDRASARIADLFGAPPRTFAYPCGQKYVGRGVEAASYVPIIARRFAAGRGFRDESHNTPGWFDPARTMAYDADGADLPALIALIDRARHERGWVVLAAHDVGDHPTQAMRPELLDALCAYAADRANGVWTATMAEAAERAMAITPTGRPV